MSYYFLSLQEVLKPFCNLLATKDDNTVGVILDDIAHILAKETQELVHLVDLLVLVQRATAEPRSCSNLHIHTPST